MLAQKLLCVSTAITSHPYGLEQGRASRVRWYYFRSEFCAAPGTKYLMEGCCGGSVAGRLPLEEPWIRKLRVCWEQQPL